METYKSLSVQYPLSAVSGPRDVVALAFTRAEWGSFSHAAEAFNASPEVLLLHLATSRREAITAQIPQKPLREFVHEQVAGILNPPKPV